MGADAYGINREVIDRIVAEIAEVTRLASRSRSSSAAATSFAASPRRAGMDRATADYMGMLAR
jgi:uridylate kinase